MPVKIALILLLICLTGCQPATPPASPTVTGLRLDHLLGDSNAEGFARAYQPRNFIFPVDHGPHPDYRSEWWYLTAALKDDDGHEYGVHFTLFRQALSPKPTGEGPWHTAQAYLGHLAIADVSGRKHLEAERFARGHPELAGVTASSHFRAMIEDWTLEGAAEDKLDLTLTASETEEFGVELRIQQTGPSVLQGSRGLSEKAKGSASYYYSIPRLTLSGTLDVKGKSVNVAGLGWLDREWSTSVLGEGLAGWDWFALQLDDARSIMAFRLRRHDGKRDTFDHGLIVNHRELDDQATGGEGDKGIQILHHKDFSLTPKRHYADARGVNWPVGWEIVIGEEEFFVNAQLDQQTVDLSIRYWEGLVEVQDSNGTRIGSGYMELTGYD